MEDLLSYSYQPLWQLYSISFKNPSSSPSTLALGSFLETQHNFIQVVSLNEESKSLDLTSQAELTYPTTKLMWCPDQSSSLLASSSDSLRLWSYDTELTLKSNLLTDNKKEYPPPITSFDWNSDSPNMIGTSIVNTTCTIWDIEKESAIAHMIAHDQPAYDIAFSHGVSIFATAGGDGSIRQFDLRNLENSAVLYEKQDMSACLRLAWNKNEPFYLATIMLESNTIVVLDTRHPHIPVYTLTGHSNCVNALAWSPMSGSHLLTGADDHQALIWDVQEKISSIEPTHVYNAESEINNVVWPSQDPEWIAIGKNKEVSILKI